MKKAVLLVIVFALASLWFKNPTISVASNDVSFNYIVKYPRDNAGDQKLPMLIALHGDGDSIKNFYETALEQIDAPARIIIIEGPLTRGRGHAWPHSPAEFSQYGKALSEAAKALSIKYPTSGKPVLMGFSGGGVMAYYQALKYGDSYSTIFPISGRLTSDVLGGNSYRTGAEVVAFHGRSDGVVGITEGKNAVSLLQAEGVSVEFIEFDGGHHGIFTNMKSLISQTIGKEIYLQM